MYGANAAMKRPHDYYDAQQGMDPRAQYDQPPRGGGGGGAGAGGGGGGGGSSGGGGGGGGSAASGFDDYYRGAAAAAGYDRQNDRATGAPSGYDPRSYASVVSGVSGAAYDRLEPAMDRGNQQESAAPAGDAAPRNTSATGNPYDQQQMGYDRKQTAVDAYDRPAGAQDTYGRQSNATAVHQYEGTTNSPYEATAKRGRY